jgi:hypothetical protein
MYLKEPIKLHFCSGAFKDERLRRLHYEQPDPCMGIPQYKTMDTTIRTHVHDNGHLNNKRRSHRTFIASKVENAFEFA